MEKIKVASLFCGCGGMDLGVLGGFSYLGKEYKENPFEIVYAVDNDPFCTKIYNDNFAHKCEVKDVREIKIEDMPEFDMLIEVFLANHSQFPLKIHLGLVTRMREVCYSLKW